MVSLSKHTSVRERISFHTHTVMLTLCFWMCTVRSMFDESVQDNSSSIQVLIIRLIAQQSHIYTGMYNTSLLRNNDEEQIRNTGNTRGPGNRHRSTWDARAKNRMTTGQTRWREWTGLTRVMWDRCVGGWSGWGGAREHKRKTEYRIYYRSSVNMTKSAGSKKTCIHTETWTINTGDYRKLSLY